MVRVEWRDRVIVITIDRPERRNAVDHDTLLALAEAQREAASGGARVVVLTGAPPAFCAGADLNGVESGEFVTALVAALRGFTELAMVTLAAIDGPALGAGTQLAVACDLRMATPASVFGIPAAKLGIAYGFDMVRRLVSLVGQAHARTLLFTGERIGSAEAQRIGLVNQVVEDEALNATVYNLARSIADNAPLSTRAMKMAVNGVLQGESERDLDAINAAVLACFDSADYREGRTAFMEKRKPVWLGR